MKLLVTGGAGFIGSAVCRHAVRDLGWSIVNVDKFTYAASEGSTKGISNSPNYKLIQADICDKHRMLEIMRAENIDAVMHLAAESHVDRSIDGPGEFIQTNIVGTYALLEAAREYHRGLSAAMQAKFRLHHVSTDEVFGDLPLEGGHFDEATAYAPSSPYSASKAASDHLVRAWHKTFGLPVVLTNCSNNYGPFHFPEKLIPLMILNAMDGIPLPVYGTGQNIRDWLYVEDHARALALVVARGEIGETYAIGGRAERSNLDVVHAIADAVDGIAGPLANGSTRRSLVKFVVDRPGHDLRYAIDCSKIERELRWKPSVDFETGLKKTVMWYLENEWWWQPLRAEKYAGQRLGQSTSTKEQSEKS